MSSPRVWVEPSGTKTQYTGQVRPAPHREYPYGSHTSFLLFPDAKEPRFFPRVLPFLVVNRHCVDPSPSFCSRVEGRSGWGEGSAEPPPCPSSLTVNLLQSTDHAASPCEHVLACLFLTDSKNHLTPRRKFLKVSVHCGSTLCP